MFNYEVFTLRLIELLESNNLTQRELAKRAEVEEATISRYINEHRQPRADVLITSALNHFSFGFFKFPLIAFR